MPDADLAARVHAFSGKRVLVLGDLAADCYVETRPARLSREAPVMVLRYQGRRFAPGCAANTAVNLRALGAAVSLAGVLGDDEAGADLRRVFAEAGISTDAVSTGERTVVKVRLMSGDFSRPQQQVMRIDVEPDGDFRAAGLRARLERLGGFDAVVVSDYGYGAASPELAEEVRRRCPGAVYCVDSRSRSLEFLGADLLTPNESEAEEALRRRVESDEEALSAAREIRERAKARCVLLTRGNRGMVLDDGEGRILPIVGSREIVDPTGAGDTVVAAASLALVAGATPLQAARLANHAAGISVMKTGAATVAAAELAEALARG